MKLSYNILVLALFLLLFSCGKKDNVPVYDLEQNENVIKNSSFANKLDSLGFLEFISKQKLQDVYDLLLWSKKTNAIAKNDSTFYNQLQNYFIEEDTLNLFIIRDELDSLYVSYVKIDKIEVLEKDSLESDSIGKINFKAHYFNSKKAFIVSKEKSATYFLKKDVKKLKKEFTFYLSEITEKDTVRKGITQ